MQDVRMPRACKRTRQSQTEIKIYLVAIVPALPSLGSDGCTVRTSGRSRAANLAELIQEQDNRRYASEPVPDVSVHYSMTGSIPSPMQQPSLAYGRTPKRPRTEAAELSNNTLQNHPREMYNTQQQQSGDCLYSRTTRNIGHGNANVSQVLYPNMAQAPRSTTPYSGQDQYSALKQIPQAATAPEQQVTAYRYNTRSVHNLNLPLSTVQTNYWNSTNTPNAGTSSIPPETQILPATAQTNPPSTQEQKSGPELKHTGSQTSLTLTDDETTFIKTIRAKRMNPRKINIIIENDQYVVTYNDESRVEMVNNLIRASQDIKISLLTKFYAKGWESMPGLLPTNNPAISYPGYNGNRSNDDESGSPPGQQESPTMLQSLLSEATQPANATNNDSTSESEEATPPPQPQEPQQRATPRGNPSLPIPTVNNQWRNTSRYQPYRYPGRSQMRPTFNPYHLLQNIQNNPRLAMNANFFPHMHAPELFRMPGWF